MKFPADPKNESLSPRKKIRTDRWTKSLSLRDFRHGGCFFAGEAHFDSLRWLAGVPASPVPEASSDWSSGTLAQQIKATKTPMNVSRVNKNKKRPKIKSGVNTGSIPGTGIEDMPDRPMSRFWLGFLILSPCFWLAFIGYGQSQSLAAIGPALLVGFLLGLICAIGKKTLHFLLNLFSGSI